MGISSPLWSGTYFKPDIGVFVLFYISTSYSTAITVPYKDVSSGSPCDEGVNSVKGVQEDMCE